MGALNFHYNLLKINKIKLEDPAKTIFTHYWSAHTDCYYRDRDYSLYALNIPILTIEMQLSVSVGALFVGHSTTTLAFPQEKT